MFPTSGLTATPQVGTLEVPLREGNLVETFYGGVSLGSSTNPTINRGMRNSLWSCQYVDNNVEITNSRAKVVVANIIGIEELSICFDKYLLPVLVYVKAGISYLRRFNISTKEYETITLDDLVGSKIKTPRLCYDDKRSLFRDQASIILGYVLNNELVIRTSDDDYIQPIIIHDFPDNQYRLNQICMGSNGRLHFVPYRNKE